MCSSHRQQPRACISPRLRKNAANLCLFYWEINHIRHKDLAQLILLEFAFERVLRTVLSGSFPFSCKTLGAISPDYCLTAHFLYEAVNLLMSRLALSSVHAKCLCHSPDSVSSFVVLFVSLDVFTESQVFKHSFARNSKTSLIEASTDMSVVAGFGNAYP
jgi:hypothetical protein